MLPVVFLPALILIISVLAKRLAWKSITNLTYLVSSGTLKLNSINQSINQSTTACSPEMTTNAVHVYIHIYTYMVCVCQLFASFRWIFCRVCINCRTLCVLTVVEKTRLQAE